MITFGWSFAGSICEWGLPEEAILVPYINHEPWYSVTDFTALETVYAS